MRYGYCIQHGAECHWLNGVQDYLDLIENCAIAPNDEKTFRLGKDIAVAISKLYRHPLYQVVMRTPSEFYLMDSAE